MRVKVKDFFKPIHLDENIRDSDYESVQQIIDIAKSLSEITYQGIYLVDYYRRNFLYVSHNPIFLCGRSPKQVLKEGYLFYLKNVPEEDLELLLKINEAGFSFFRNLPLEDRLKYSISYDFHLIPQIGNKMLVNHKVKPLLLDKYSNPWIALCIVSLSASTEPGNIRFVSSELKKNFQFDLMTNEWVETPRIRLSKRDKDILRYSVQGLTMDQIASKMKLSIDTIKYHKKGLFSLLHVKSITEATVKAIELALL